ncbi:hypothetical protein [Sanguibacter sp. 25GB23B1]|uniref:hypothetical protein n=1 Tax=unclassified Sanguibacter TaxID=2645534 RepID=UPI0032AF4218
MNTTPRTVLSIGLLGSALALTGCSSDADEATPSPTTSTVAEPTETPSETADPTATEEPDDGSLLDGEQEVEIGTYAGTFIAPSVEGGVITVEDPAASEVPAQWVITPIEGSGETYQLMTVALTDGVASCLSLPLEGDVSLATCDAADTAQTFRVTALDSPEMVSLSSSAGFLGVNPDDGMLEVFPSGDQLSSTFTLVAK